MTRTDRTSDRERDQTWATATLLLLKAQGGGSIEVPLNGSGQAAMLRDAIQPNTVHVVDDHNKGTRTIILDT